MKRVLFKSPIASQRTGTRHQAGRGIYSFPIRHLDPRTKSQLPFEPLSLYSKLLLQVGPHNYRGMQKGMGRYEVAA
ncbi:unnamed protein product [Sphenostylis stenocarpa]|uniref:Uncharacterized protein n=1 Tax=Sphenostylis stenocarpa TaxID=92480 RepID=A0AA86VRJ7_9FABA|nr:unnamed protein product [Sphenostylis stenocarpa]